MIKIKDLKPIVSKNIAELRRANGITQLELAEKLNYSDKAVSKWERGESMPDVGVLKEIADIFNVTVDQLISEDKLNVKELTKEETEQRNNNHFIITAMSVLLVLLIATFVFVVILMASGMSAWNLLIFAYCAPICSIVLLVFNSIWFNPRYNFFIISVLMWSFIAVLYLTFQAVRINIAPLFFVGIPGQIIIVMWSKLKFKPKKLFNKIKRESEEDSSLQ